MQNTLLKIDKISKIYTSEKEKVEALKNISFDIKEKEILGLLGVNGAGKTTLSSIIATLLKPTSGDILFNGNSIYKDVVSFRKILGFCPQVQNLDLDLNVKENLTFAGRYYLLTKKQIKQRIEYLLEKFDLTRYEKFSLNSLSGGYKQRFLIARTLMHDPKLIIMDEPTVGLDPQLRRLLWKYILDLKAEGKTIILTTHYLDEADILSDRICVIDAGSLKALEKPSKLKERWKSESLEDVFLELIKEKDKEEKK
ncbi:MAG: ABC transporter ATP-binding protein NatA [Candidatus Anoxychlamydiales bacterium]|nr:ABC transporter ATP-binding protein NatA [Candidatus Anoxychlamydiales bacterium]NGX41454.1 ABC transporter ATP-binding protein NatA [Candidatus Anoxychlamydiales bacterium]HEU64672.1 ABC transporter ATP-binding protein [Chlamydiota bacterium]